MTSALTVAELRTLIAHHNGPCLSIYMPTHRGGSAEEPIHFGNCLREARNLLLTGYPKVEVESLLAPLSDLDRPDFWHQSIDGLAIFRSHDKNVFYRLPLKLEHLVVAADSFHIRPLLRFLQSNQRYFLLNLTQNRVSFFKGSALGLAPVEIPGMPRSLTDVIGADAHPHFTSTLSGGPMGHSPIHHGQGKEESVHEEELARFARAVDKALWEVLRDETAPLVVASIEKTLSLYRSISRYPHVLDDGIHGSLTNAKLEDQHHKAWPLVQAWQSSREQEILERYGNSISSGKAVDSLAKIARFALGGRVRELLVDRDAHKWGSVDRTTGEIQLHEKQTGAHDDDVIDDVAEDVILRGGAVYAFERAKMPTSSPVAAILRW
jgi:hypothetical protein